MFLYENAPVSTYEEFKTWYPIFYQYIVDMDALWQVFGDKMDGLRDTIIRLVDNNFIDYADEPTITRIESWLGIEYENVPSLPTRRNVIKGFIIGQGHIGRQQIKEIIALFTNAAMDVAFARGIITVTLSGAPGDVLVLPYAANMVLNERIPAHLRLINEAIVEITYPVTTHHYAAPGLYLSMHVTCND